MTTTSSSSEQPTHPRTISTITSGKRYQVLWCCEWHAQRHRGMLPNLGFHQHMADAVGATWVEESAPRQETRFWPVQLARRTRHRQ